MRVVAPQPFMFEGGKRAVLLLHGFTGTTADVRMLGRYLQGKGYTGYAPLYKGHGVPPEELLETKPEDWWETVERGYRHLQDSGYTEIAVIGLSIGGVFSLKVGYTIPVKGIVTMCAPMLTKSDEAMYKGFLAYAKKYKQLERKSAEQVELELDRLKNPPHDLLSQIKNEITTVKEHLNEITSPIFIVQARHDEMIDTESANIIHQDVKSIDNSLKWYEESSHVITLDKEKEQLHADVYDFLERLNWSD